jgi:hypothetical protein
MGELDVLATGLTGLAVLAIGVLMGVVIGVSR